MADVLKLVETTQHLRESVYAHTACYYHSRPMIRQRTGFTLPGEKAKYTLPLTYGIRDLFLVGALTHSSLLLTGPTDLGKTMFAKLGMNSLFGPEELGWHKINIDIEFSKDMAASIDYKAIMEGRSSEEVYRLMPFLELAGLITDEINRSHSKLNTSLMHFFDREITLPNGKKARLGRSYGKDGRYQFQIAAINEGEEYSGTFDIDKAMRRRTIIEIPMGVFTPLPADRVRAHGDFSKELRLTNRNDLFDDVVSVYGNLGEIPLHDNANLFLAYLESFDYCEHSLTKEKGSVPTKGGNIYHICTKPVQGVPTVCPFIRSFEDELCPYVTGISPGIAKNLISVAKGLALLRGVKIGEALRQYSIGESPELEPVLRKYTACALRGDALAAKSFQKYVRELEVLPEDIEAVFGFVAYSKIGLATPWIIKHYQGNRFAGVEAFLRQAKEKFEEGVGRLLTADPADVIAPGPADYHKLTSIQHYCQTSNPWLWQALQAVNGTKDSPPPIAESMAFLYS